MSLIALDLGTSSIKGAVIDPERRRLEHIERLPFPEPFPDLPPLFFEVDPGRIVTAVRGIIGRLLPHAPNCSGLVMCGQMGGLVLTTARGAPLSNYISWRDQRLLLPPPSGAGTYFDRLSERLSPLDRSQLGNEVRPGAALSYLFWLAEEKRLPASGAIAAALPDYVLANLCGAAPVMHRTLAVGGLNLATLEWHHTLFDRLRLGSIGWPALGGIQEPVGRLEIDGQSLTCYAPVGDHQCALAGAGIGYRELSLNISTGSQVGLLTPALELGNYQTRPFFDGRFLNTITHIPAGRSLDVLVRLLGELAEAQQVTLDDPWPYIQQAATSAAETDLEVSLAFFPGPAGERGAIANIREGNLSVGQLFYAAFRNMADIYQACALRLSPTQNWDSLVFSGGLAQKVELLRQMIGARLSGRPRLCAASEDTLLGLLAVALVVSGRAASMDSASAELRTAEGELP